MNELSDSMRDEVERLFACETAILASSVMRQMQIVMSAAVHKTVDHFLRMTPQEFEEFRDKALNEAAGK